MGEAAPGGLVLMTTVWGNDARISPLRPSAAWRDQVARREAFEQASPDVRIRCVAGWWKAWPPGLAPLTCATLAGLLDALGAP